jgi:diguanylate cyclase (GGDEF)-like protein
MPKSCRVAALVALFLIVPNARAEEDCWDLVTKDARRAPAILRGLIAKAPNDVERAGLQTCIGYAFEQIGDVNAAMVEYEKAVALATRAKDKEALANALALRGELRHYRGEFSAALEDLQRAYALQVERGSENDKRYVLNAIANLYADRRVGAYDRALEYYRQVLASNERAKNLPQMATARFNIAATLDTKGDHVGALVEFRRALELERATKNADGIADVQRGMGITLGKLDRNEEALAVLDQALERFVAIRDEESSAAVRLARGTVLRKLGRSEEALRELERARVQFESTSSSRFLEKAHDERAQLFAATGDWRRAYEARRAQMATREKLNQQLREEHVSRLRVQFDTEKKEQENRTLVRENAYAARIRNLQRGVIALGALVIGFLIYLVVRHLSTARTMRALALTDELTKLPNRRHVLTFADEQLKAARSGGKGFAVLALDIDFFKRINDTLGHDAGDVVLRRVADTCRAALRGNDRMGRVGGEEFLVVLPGSDANTAAEVAERLRSAVEQIDCSDLAPDLRITVSIGVTEWKSADDFSTIVKRADDSLYRAKEGGRNRVELAYA